MLYCFLRPRNAGNVQVLTYSKMACLYNANGIHQHQGKHWPILRNRPKMKKKKTAAVLITSRKVLCKCSVLRVVG